MLLSLTKLAVALLSAAAFQEGLLHTSVHIQHASNALSRQQQITDSGLQGSLAVATQMLMSEDAYAVPGLRAALGRLANSVVAVLGPELSPGTDVYSKCKALIREIQVVLELINVADVSTKQFAMMRCLMTRLCMHNSVLI